MIVNGKGGVNCTTGAPLVDMIQPGVRSNRKWRLEKKEE